MASRHYQAELGNELLVVHGRRDSEDYEALEQVYSDKMEAKKMLEIAIAQEQQMIFAQGKAQGWLEGKAEGELLGKANLLISMLEKRFGSLMPVQKKHIYELDATSLLKLAEKLWNVQSLQEVWDEDEHLF